MATDPEKVKRAAKHPDRPGEECHAVPGTWRPVVETARCEGKRDCEAVCPHDVFDVRRMDAADFAALGMFAKLKKIGHQRLNAYTPRAADCHACGLCVVACPEKAIRLERVG